MTRLIFLLEEPSMKTFLEGLLPRLFPGLELGRDFLCIKHEGRSDLESSIPRKLRAWNEPDAKFIVLRDNDGGDCIQLKAHLRQLCAEGHRDDVLVRIACQELEAWYLGDLAALAEEYAVKIAASQTGRTYRDPDRIGSPASLLKRHVPGFQKGDGSRRMGQRLHPGRNQSRSFQVLVAGIASALGRSVEPMETRL
jgi:hypothetical protein